MVGSSLLLPLLLNGVAAFAPMPSATSSSIHRYQSATTKMNQMFPESSASSLEILDEGESDDPFDNYKASDEQKVIATKDIAVGSGYTIGETEGQTLEIQYTAKLVVSKFSGNLKEFDVPSMVFKTGEGRCLPGLEEGVQGMKVGGNRKIKVPPNKGYGDNWYRGIVPPNSHLEFDCTLVKIAQSPVEEFGMWLERFGVGRAVGATVCFAYLALSPMLEQKGLLPF